MMVTNLICNKIIYDNSTKDFHEKEISNNEIIEKLKIEKERKFLSYSWGIFITSIARNNIIRNIVALDDYVIYSDTDSIKLKKGYDKKVIEKYNDYVRKLNKKASEDLGIDFDKFCPKDKNGKPHLLGLFELEDENLEEFKTLGAKKYCYKKDGEIKITVAGVPKKGAKQLKNLIEFDNDLIFKYEYTGKNQLLYNDKQIPVKLKDYEGKEKTVNDRCGIAVFPCEYKLKESLVYSANLLDETNERAFFKEGDKNER